MAALRRSTMVTLVTRVSFIHILPDLQYLGYFICQFSIAA